jgi:hypothetical protein
MSKYSERSSVPSKRKSVITEKQRKRSKVLPSASSTVGQKDVIRIARDLTSGIKSKIDKTLKSLKTTFSVEVVDLTPQNGEATTELVKTLLCGHVGNLLFEALPMSQSSTKVLWYELFSLMGNQYDLVASWLASKCD